MHRHLLALLASTAYAPPPAEGGGAGAGSDAFEALGNLRAINAGSAPEELSRTLEVHRNVLVQLGGDVTRIREATARMVPETTELLKQARAQSRVEYEPNGNARLLDLRYIEGDGIRFGRSVEVVNVPGVGSVETVKHGLLTDPNTVTIEHERVRRAYGAYALARAIASRRNGAEGLVKRSYLAFRSAMLDLPGQVGDMVRRAFNDPNLFQRVVGNVAGSGGELIATPTLGTIIRPTDLARRIAGLIPVIDVPGSTFKQPIVTGRALSRRRGSTADDPARYPVQTFTTSDQTLSVVDRVIQVLLDDTWATEAGHILADPMGEVMRYLADGDADTLELAFFHGDTTATHQDAIASWTMGGRYTAGQLDGTNSPLRFWKGFRREAVDRSATVAGGGTLDAADHFGALELMGPRAATARVAVGLHGFYTQFLANALFTTVDKAGPAATLQTGQLGQIGDTPIDIVDSVPNDFASTGLYTGSGTTTVAVYYDPNSYAHYFHSGGSDEWDVRQPEKGAQYVGMKRRSLLYKTCLSTEAAAAMIINL